MHRRGVTWRKIAEALIEHADFLAPRGPVFQVDAFLRAPSKPDLWEFPESNSMFPQKRIRHDLLENPRAESQAANSESHKSNKIFGKPSL
jgi:hypothetical protein